jgi:hypothetical protein
MNKFMQMKQAAAAVAALAGLAAAAVAALAAAVAVVAKMGMHILWHLAPVYQQRPQKALPRPQTKKVWGGLAAAVMIVAASCLAVEHEFNRDKQGHELNKASKIVASWLTSQLELDELE